MALSELCVYTIVDPVVLAEAARHVQVFQRSEGKSWATAEKLWRDAVQLGDDFPVLLGDAADCSRLEYWGILRSLNITSAGTEYMLDCVRRLPRLRSPQDLVLRNTGKNIAPGFIRPYAVCRTPAFLKQEYGKGTKEIQWFPKLQAELRETLLVNYRLAGETLGYWGHRFRQALDRKGALQTVKDMLRRQAGDRRAGLDVLLEAGHSEWTVEAVVLKPQFRPLFTSEEIQAARSRLGRKQQAVAERAATRERLYPEELEPGRTYPAGQKKRIVVNAYERKDGARKSCLQAHGYRCTVCGLLMSELYGDIGEEFIHVHHLKQLALAEKEYELDPVVDLCPTCPNCHAMLHRREPPYTIEELKERLRKPST